MGLKGNGVDVVAESNEPGRSETFQIVRKSGDLNRVRIKAPNGFFLQASFDFFLNLGSSIKFSSCHAHN